ncbi:MAG: preprotein translocase subunit SecA [Leptospiraceae bacterium]|nr:preprotein translocase subunit SecA [Leptospiraceae bacterium]
MFQKALQLVFGTKHERDIKKMIPIVEKINALEPEMKKLSLEDFVKKTNQFKEIIKNSKDVKKTLDELLPEAFALVREAAWRTIGQRHFNVQLMGGIVLHQGKIAEMKTGEGKTLTATLAIYLNALTGKGVHVVTVNDYLAKRDANWMKPIYDLLGVSVGYIQNQMDFEERKKAYQMDITYGTNNEFGFDYLRDNMVTDLYFRVQRGHYYAIVDEVDSILIDEARTPLIISGPTEDNVAIYQIVDRAVRQLIQLEEKAPPPPPRKVEPGQVQIEEPHVIRGYYYDIDEKARIVLLTEEGIKKIEEILKISNLFAPEYVNMVAAINQALKAHLIFKNEVDYIVENGEVIIIDEHTGRKMIGRRYSDGLHQAIEAKEGVPIKQETQTLATITFQNYFRMYEKLAGMTGTADTEAEEFKKIYNLDVVVIPTNKPVIRIDYPDKVYKTEKEKFNAIIQEIIERHEKGQPLLIGTISIEKSEQLSQMLKKYKIPHAVLNAKYHEKEAEIIANAGKPGAVTIATNMAGRGTDIILGGYPTYLKDLEHFQETEPAIREFKEAILKKEFERAKEIIPNITKTEDQKFAKEILDKANIWLENHKKVIEAGGLHIIGTERHESRRIDNQLRGRAGRQGDPGSSRFYLSLEDHLLRLFGGDGWRNMMQRLWVEEGQEIESRIVDKSIARAQKKVENHNFDIRKHLLEYDDVLNRQREIIYKERDRILMNQNVREMIYSFLEDVIEKKILLYCEHKRIDLWELSSLEEWFKLSLNVPVNITSKEFVEQLEKAEDPQLFLYEYLLKEAKKYYEEKISLVGENDFSYIEKRIVLDIIDTKWKEHLYLMDQLREGIWTSSYSERNPLVEYKLKGFELFDAMMENIKEHVIEFLFRIQIEGPVQSKEEQKDMRNIGTEKHESLNALTPTSTQKNHQPIVVSSGGASKRKSLRRRKR